MLGRGLNTIYEEDEMDCDSPEEQQNDDALLPFVTATSQHSQLEASTLMQYEQEELTYDPNLQYSTTLHSNTIRSDCHGSAFSELDNYEADDDDDDIHEAEADTDDDEDEDEADADDDGADARSDEADTDEAITDNDEADTDNEEPDIDDDGTDDKTDDDDDDDNDDDEAVMADLIDNLQEVSIAGNASTGVRRVGKPAPLFPADPSRYCHKRTSAAVLDLCAAIRPKAYYPGVRRTLQQMIVRSQQAIYTGKRAFDQFNSFRGQETSNDGDGRDPKARPSKARRLA